MIGSDLLRARSSEMCNGVGMPLGLLALQEKSKLEMDNSVSNQFGNEIPNRLETEFSVSKTLVSNCVHLNSVSN